MSGRLFICSTDPVMAPSCRDFVRGIAALERWDSGAVRSSSAGAAPESNARRPERERPRLSSAPAWLAQGGATSPLARRRNRVREPATTPKAGTGTIRAMRLSNFKPALHTHGRLVRGARFSPGECDCHKQGEIGRQVGLGCARSRRIRPGNRLRTFSTRTAPDLPSKTRIGLLWVS